MLKMIQKYGLFESRSKVVGALMRINRGKALLATSLAGAALVWATCPE